MDNYDNKGWLAKNTKRKSDNAPEYIGVVRINGKDMRLAGWVRDGKYGKLIALKISEDTYQKPGAASKRPALDDDIPF